MKNRYKVLFWISAFLLIVTNLYWLYNTLDNAVDHNYYEVSCTEWRKDNSELKKLLPLDSDYAAMLGFIRSKKLHFDTFEEGETKVVQFHSFDLIYDKHGKLLELNER